MAWNSTAQSDCSFDQHYNSDFDLDGDDDTEDGATNCEGRQASLPGNDVAAYVSGRDWLEDLVDASDPAGCNGTLTNRGTQYDWLRFWWDLVTDEGVSFPTAFDVYDSMNPRSFDADGTATPSDLTDDPCAAGSTSRLPAACAAHGVGTACSNQRDNGQDH